jgi:predicted secreted Zn-dependent protease
MKNGRCRMHGGLFYKREKHGGRTLRAIKQRKQERAILKEMKAVSREIEQKCKDFDHSNARP